MTPVGRELAARARRVLTEVEEIRRYAEQSKGGMAATIRFGVTPTLGPYLMPSAILSLHRDFPDLRLYIREGIPDAQLTELVRGDLDMMLCPLPISEPGLHIEPLFREPLQLVGPPDHRLAGKSECEPHELAGEAVLSIDTAHHLHRQTEALVSEVGAHVLRDYQGTSLDSLRQMAGSGLGLAFLPELYLRAETGGEDMVSRFAIKGWSATRSIAAVWRQGTAMSETYMKIAQLIAEHARRLLA